jgi:hypothetical protein
MLSLHPKEGREGLHSGGVEAVIVVSSQFMAEMNSYCTKYIEEQALAREQQDDRLLATRRKKPPTASLQ